MPSSPRFSLTINKVPAGRDIDRILPLSQNAIDPNICANETTLTTLQVYKWKNCTKRLHPVKFCSGEVGQEHAF
ncbi:hypothetical protein PHET_01960 [Paragonimus heterotremus]|uniref:Uncharacterized protein n=1 Tax=Paragonimus heterotremus TaxID=100268 RepID=A0A8J4WU54_9TREM|nr:hypothetical protein PHET_01960 [Paragonimus heterotremus]